MVPIKRRTMEYTEIQPCDLIPCMRAGSRFSKLCFSHDSRYIFCCCGSIVKVFNTINGECIHDLDAHKKPVHGVFINPGNVLQLFTCGLDGLLLVWDYMDGVKLKEFDVHMPLYGIVSVNADKNSIIMLAETSVHKKVYSLMLWKRKKNEPGFSSPKMLIEKCSKENGLASFGCSGEFLASGLENMLTVYSMKKDSKTVLQDHDKYNKKKNILSVACHPKDHIIAAGLETGQILLWQNVFYSKTPVCTRLHWHALPCLCLSFTPDGSHLLSGGHECVLVKWQTQMPDQRDFKPRLGAPLTQVLTSPNGTLFATLHADNVVQLLGINLSVQQAYRGLTRASLGAAAATRSNLMPVGLIYDPRSHALVTNGLPGHLQFFSLKLNRQLYNLDVVGENYISPENLSRPTAVTEVTAAALSPRGRWLATFQVWDDGHFSPEHKLKLWCWSSEAQTYSLNTTVECPHEGRVSFMTFKPQPSPDDVPTLLTLGSDCCFKTWALIDDTDIYRSNTRWDCESVGEYRGLPAGCADFSADATALAVGFGHLLTLWDHGNTAVRVTLSSGLPDRPNLSHLLFGNKDSAHFIAAATSNTLIVWDLLTLTVSWKLSVEVSVLIKDPDTNLMAVVTADSSLLVLTPGSASPVFQREAVSPSPVLVAAFLPAARPPALADLAWPGTSQIYLFNADEELITFDVPDLQKKAEKVKIAQNLPEPAIKAFIAEKKVSDKKTSKTKVPLGSNKMFDEEYLSSLLHSNEPVSLMCDQFIKTLLIKSPGSEGFSQNEVLKTEDSDSDMETDDDPLQAKVIVEKKALPIAKDSDDQHLEDEMNTFLSKPLDWIQWADSLNVK